MLGTTERVIAAVVVLATALGASVSAAPSTATSAASHPATKPAAHAPATRAADVVNPALSERIAYQMAQGLLRARPIVEGSWDATCALLEASLRLNPEEPRIMRMLIEALLRKGDGARALEILGRYRATEEGKDDQGAQTQSIDLYAAKIETIDKRVAYLKDIAGRVGIAEPVRSYAAVRAAEQLAERMQNREALAMVDEALRLNPSNLKALRIRFESMRATATPVERLAGMLAMLKANPAQPALALAVAQELADGGAAPASLQWYTTALNMYFKLSQQPGADAILGYAAELFVSGDARGADAVASKLSAADPDALDTWMLRLIAGRVIGDKEAMASVTKLSQVAMTNRLAMLKRRAGDETATTRPVETTAEVPVVDVAADLQKIQKANKPELTQEFAVVAQGMAWTKIYFEEKPADADPWISALSKVLPADDARLARLQGWQAIRQNKLDVAKSKLSAVASRDPIAQAGLILLNDTSPAGVERARGEARTLLQKNPSGLTGAAVLEILSPVGAKLVPGALAEQLQNELTKFPKNWMQVTDNPANYYTLRIEPVRSALQVGDPVLVRVSILNTSEQDLTMGEDGLVHPDLWMDAQLRGADQQVLPWESFDRITKRLVLPPKQSVSQVSRLDTNRLTETLMRYPSRSFQVNAMVMTNPTTIQGQVTNGLAGYRVQLQGSRLMERQGAPILTESVRQKVADTLQNGTPDEKVKAIELLGTYVQLFSMAENPPADLKQLTAMFAESIRHMLTDGDPGVRGWTQYVLSFMLNEADRASLLKQMVEDEGWEPRLLASVVVARLAQMKDAIKPLQKDADPQVRELATAIVKMPLTPLTTQPAATQPVAPAPTVPAPRPTPPAHPATAPSGGGSVGLPSPSTLPAVP